MGFNIGLFEFPNTRFSLLHKVVGKNNKHSRVSVWLVVAIFYQYHLLLHPARKKNFVDEMYHFKNLFFIKCVHEHGIL